MLYCPIKQVSFSVNVLLSTPVPRLESHTSFHHHGLLFQASNCFWLVLAVALAVTKRTGDTLENCPIAYVSVILSRGYTGLTDWSSALNTLVQRAWGQVTSLLMTTWATCWPWHPQGFSSWRWGFLFLPQLVICAHRVHLMLKGRESDINPLEVDQSLSRLVWSYTMSNKYLGLGTLRLCQYPVSQRPVPRCGIPACPLQPPPPGSSHSKFLLSHSFCVYYLEFLKGNFSISSFIYF